MSFRLASICVLVLAAAGCGALSNGDGGNNGNQDMFGIDGTGGGMEDMAMTTTQTAWITVDLHDTMSNFQRVNCDDPQAKITTVHLAFKNNNSGGMSTYDMTCPAGKDTFEEMKVPLPAGQANDFYTVDATTVGMVQKSLTVSDFNPGMAISLHFYVFQM